MYDDSDSNKIDVDVLQPDGTRLNVINSLYHVDVPYYWYVRYGKNNNSSGYHAKRWTDVHHDGYMLYFGHNQTIHDAGTERVNPNTGIIDMGGTIGCCQAYSGEENLRSQRRFDSIFLGFTYQYSTGKIYFNFTPLAVEKGNWFGQFMDKDKGQPRKIRLQLT